ncbi:hypothetical protein [Pseudovibrio sp. JE062]|uniref:hypothetical protein n=1 Tax=Pseudovibrio sp. JE062 TaxID=439495 RepID=UPI001AD92A7B|nr:hypothetical protein [Pseudovibrio sp. JE062]
MRLPHKINELRQDPKVLRERVTVLAWGIAALSFVALAASAVQMPGKFAAQTPHFAQAIIPLPAPGPVTTTASISGQTAQNAFQIYGGASEKAESQQELQNTKELRAVREEIVSLRRSMLRLTEQNRRLSSKLKALDEAESQAQTEAKAAPKPAVTVVKPKQKPITPIETLPAPELSAAKPQPQAPGPLPEMKLSELTEITETTLPNASVPETVASIPAKAELPEFHKTPAAGKLSQSGRRKIVRTSFAVDLGSFDDTNALNSQWQKLKDNNPLLLGDLKKRVSTAEVDGTTQFTLTAGPFFNAADTAVVCARLVREKVNCSPTIFQ